MKKLGYILKTIIYNFKYELFAKSLHSHTKNNTHTHYTHIIQITYVIDITHKPYMLHTIRTHYTHHNILLHTHTSHKLRRHTRRHLLEKLGSKIEELQSFINPKHNVHHDMKRMVSSLHMLHESYADMEPSLADAPRTAVAETGLHLGLEPV